MSHHHGGAIPIFDTDALDAVDLDSAFVTVDSNRINLTFRQIFKLLRAIGPNMANFERLLSSQGAEVTKLQNTTSNMELRMREADDTIAAHDARLRKCAEVQHTHQSRLDALEKRVAAQERQNADLKDLGETLSKLRSDIRQLQSDTEGLDDTMKRHTNQIDATVIDAKKTSDALAKERDRVTAIYNVFEMDEKKVLTANAHGSAAAAAANSSGSGANSAAARRLSSGAAAGSAVEAVNQVRSPQPPSSASPNGSPTTVSSPTAPSPTAARPLSHQVQYLFTLPAFAALRADCAATVAAAEARGAAELDRAVAKLNGDLSALRGRLADKVDIRDFKPFEAEVREALKRMAGLFASYDKLVIEVQGKADRAETERRLAHLQATKADRSDLLGVVTMDDLRALDKKIQDLSDAFDALLGKINLELGSLRNARHVPVAASSPSGDGMDPSLPGRVARLEEETKELFAVKADRAELEGLVRSLRPADAPLTPTTPFAAAAAVPPPPLSARAATSPHRPAAPVSRPSSATSGSRAPHTPLQYTSTSPARNPPIFNKGRFSASAVLYDSDGNRTPASVTAARAVGNVEHLHNVARHVANRGGDIPDDHTVHVLP